ncbi:MAG TPA: thioredoxin-dependent thiol peroxidase [Bacteroidia bacterium]|jgi:peroxiredoxin Q/BCP|nr:thioredoxin-dependent thiol peroxidase [Bacteroidia bacterium]
MNIADMAKKLKVTQNVTKVNKLKVGDKAPDFSLNNQDGKTLSLKDYKGKKVVLYFYPKDDTPGCTAESCNLRDNYSSLKKKGYEVIGVSVDNEKSHKKFANKFSLPFNLLADTEKDMVENYGVWGEKMLFGRKYMGIIRTTFIIDENGKIEKIINDVETEDHTKQVFA